MKRKNSLFSLLLAAALSMTFSAAGAAEGTAVSPSDEEQVSQFALVAKNGAAFAMEGTPSSASIRRGSGLILGGSLVLKERSVVRDDNKLYYKPGVSFTVVNDDGYATKPSKYCSPTFGSYVITAPDTPRFVSEGLEEIPSVSVLEEDVVIDRNSYIHEVFISGQKRKNLIFNVPAGQTLFVKIDSLTFEGSRQYNEGSLLVQGGGTVCLDVDNLPGSGVKNINAPSYGFSWENYQLKEENQLVMFIENSSGARIENLRAEGDVYLKNSMTAAGVFNVFGNLIAGGDVIYEGKTNGGASEEFNILGQLYAPDGLVHTVGAARIRGQLIADKAELYGNSTIYYHEFHYIEVTPDTAVEVPDQIPDIEVGTDVVPDIPNYETSPSPTPDVTETPAPTTQPDPSPTPVPSNPLIPDNDVDTPHISITSNHAFIYGYTDTTMAPDMPVTREEAAAIVNRVLYQENQRGGFTKPAVPSFTDLDSGRWSYSALEYMTAVGVYDASGTRQISPATPVTRGEVAKLIAFSLGLQPTGADLGFSDLDRGHPFYKYLDALVSEGYFIGSDDNKIYPDQLMKRCEFVIMFNRIIGRDSDSYQLFYENGEVVPCPFTDLAGHYSYADMMKASCSFDENGFVDPSLKLDRNELDFELTQ